MKDLDVRERGHLEAECEGTQHRSLENNSSMMEGYFTSVGCTGRSAPSHTLGRHCAFDSSLGSQVSCSSGPSALGLSSHRVKQAADHERNVCLEASLT